MGVLPVGVGIGLYAGGVDGVEGDAGVAQKVHGHLHDVFDALALVDRDVGEIQVGKASANPDHVFVAGMPLGRLGDTLQGEERLRVAFGEPAVVVGLPREGGEVVVERVQNAVFALGVVLQDVELLQGDGDEHGGLVELVRLLP